MAELVHFYRGGLTPESFERLDSGQLLALMDYRDAYVEAMKNQR